MRIRWCAFAHHLMRAYAIGGAQCNLDAVCSALHPTTNDRTSIPPHMLGLAEVAENIQAGTCLLQDGQGRLRTKKSLL